MKEQGGWRRSLSVSNTSGEVYGEEWSMMHNGRHIAYFEEYSHGPKNIKGIEAKELETTMWNPYEGHKKQKAELNIEIYEL
jgi:hypothetical protein